MKPTPPPAALNLSWLDDLVSQGRVSFTTEEARAAHGGSDKAAQAVLRRWRMKGEIASPLRGFHIVVPPEYRRLGCLPPLWFIDDLCDWLDQPYYVALLSAAELHGAAHQRPQTFQVMLPRPQRPVRCGGVRIDFVQRSNLSLAPVVRRNTPKGTVRIATPELTALDLVGYPQHVGGLDNAATVLMDLVDEIDPVALAAVAELSPLPWAQRLGFLLDRVGASEKTTNLAAWVLRHDPATSALDPARFSTGAPADARWKLIVNAAVEVEG